MKKTMFKGFSMVLCSILLVLMLSMTSYAAEEYTSGNWTYTFGDKGCTIVSYSGTSKNVTIPSTLDGYRVSAIGRQAFAQNYTMQTVTIPESITHIGPEAFYQCAGLSQINFNAKNCSVPEIWRYDSNKGVGVFSGAGSAAPSLKVVFGSGVTNIPKDLFNTDAENGYDYAHITSVTFSTGVKTIGSYAFENCRDLQSVTLGTNVTTIGDHAFYDCASMTKATFNNKLQTVGDCSFENCVSLETISWGKGLDTIGNYAFKGCSSLEKAIIPTPTTVIGKQAFANDISLEEITIPSSMTTIGAEAFYGTIKLSKINFNAKNCTIPDIWQYDGNKGVGVFSGSGSAVSTQKVVFGSTVTAVPKNLFNTDKENGYEICHLTNIEFSKSVKEIGPYAFQDCENLETVKMGTGITTIGDHAFYACTNLTKLTLNNKLATIGDCAFENCVNLESIVWGSGLDTIGNYAFKGCTSLTAAKIPYPATVIGRQAFCDNTSLKTLTIPTSMTEIGAEAFYNTTRLSTINFNAKNCSVPGIWQYDSNKGVGVFCGAGSGTSSLKVTFGPKVTVIPSDLFNTDVENGYDHAYVTSATIPSSVKEIGFCAFQDCQRLTSVTYQRSKATIGEDVFKGCPAKLKVKCYYNGTMDSYAKTNNIKVSYLNPTKPALDTIKNKANGIEIKWKAASGVSKYYIYKKTSASGTWQKFEVLPAKTRTFVDDEVKAGKTYYYTVKAYAPGNLFSKFNKTGLKIERLKATKGVSASNVADGVKIKWKKSTGATSYQVYRSKGNGSYKKIDTVTKLSYVDKNAVNGNKYRYKIFAYDKNNKSRSVASSVATIYCVEKPSKPKLTSKKAGNLTVTWAKNNTATGYKIQYAKNSSFKNAKTITVKSKATKTKTIEKLTKGKQYYVRVCTYKTVNKKTYTSVWSAAATKTVKK